MEKNHQQSWFSSNILQDCFDDRPLTDLLQRENLDSQLQDSILYGVLRHSNSSRPPSGREALDILKTYGESVGRYGIDTGPYLTPLYGCGELPQVCRESFYWLYT